MKKRKFPFFLLLILVVSIACITATCIGWNYVDTLLDEYQQTRPENVIDDYFERLRQGDYSLAMALAEYRQNEFNTKDAFIQWLDSRYGGNYDDLKYIKEIGSDNSRTIYSAYRTGSPVLGRVVLCPTGEKTEHGFPFWKVCDADKAEYLPEYTFTVPGDTYLYINDARVPDEYITSRQQVEDFPAYGEFDAPTVKTYTVGGLTVNSVFRTVTGSGTECVLKSAEEGCLTYAHNNESRYIIEALARQSIDIYSTAVQTSGEIDTYLSYLLEGTDFYKTMKDYHRWWIIYQPDYKSAEVLNLEFTDYIEYTAERISVDLKFDYKIVSSVMTDTFPSAYRIHFIKIGDSWKIANMSVL